MNEDQKVEEVVNETTDVTSDTQSDVVINTEEQIVQNEASDTPVVEQEPFIPLEGSDRELALLELQAIVTMLGAQYQNPNMRNVGKNPDGSDKRQFKGTYTTASIYGLEEIYALKMQADTLCQKLGINLRVNRD